MSKPVIVVLSSDQRMASELPGLFQGRAEIRSCDSLEQMIELADQVGVDALVADFRCASSGGHQEAKVLEVMQRNHPGARLAMVTSEVCPETLERCAAVAEITHLRGHLDRAALLKAFGSLFSEENNVNERELEKLEAGIGGNVPADGEPPLGVLMGISRRYETNSPYLKQMLSDLEVAASHNVTILLIGETGAGKTDLSRLIHEVSPRRYEPFVPVACGALPNDLIESELFGHSKGSFTSAHQDKEGKFISARRGSLLLDEIDALGLDQQVKLLRVIETGEFEPVGSNHTQVCQARLIVASNLELQPLVEQHRFRSDLYYRLNMMKFVIPPLRHRKIDVIFCRNGRLLKRDLPQHILSGNAGPTNDPTVILSKTQTSAKHDGTQDVLSLESRIALSEKEIIEQSLFKNSFRRTKTAQELGISRVTLYNKMRKYGLQR